MHSMSFLLLGVSQSNQNKKHKQFGLMGVVVVIVKQATISNKKKKNEWPWFCAGWSYLWWGGGPGYHPNRWPRWQSPPPAAAGQGGCVAFDPTPRLSYERCLCACIVTSACQRQRREKQVASLKLKEWWRTSSTLPLHSMIHICTLKVQNKAELTDQKADIENLSKIKVLCLFYLNEVLEIHYLRYDAFISFTLQTRLCWKN